MKPWERNWNTKTQTDNVKPWERNWTGAEVDITKVKASDMMGEQGFDNKPFEKLNNYIQKITEVKVNEDADYSIKDAWEGFKNNLSKFEVRKSDEKPEGVQVLEDTAKEALDISKQYAEATKKAVVNADVKDLGKGTKEVSKALGRATAEFTIGGVGKVVSMVGDLMYDETDTTNMSKFEANKIKGGNFTAETYKKIGRYLQDLSDMAVQSELLKEDPEIFSGSFVENPSLTRLLSFGASAAPSLWMAGGLHKLGVPNKLNGMILAGLESSDVYGEAREAGKGKGEALGLFALSSAGTAYLETKGLDNLFDNKMKSLAGRMITTMGSEGFTEYWQTVYQNAVKKYGYDATQDLFEGGFEALIGGILGGGGAQMVNTAFDKFSKKADKYGVTQEEKMAILNAVSNETNAKSEQLNAMFQSNYDKSMKTLEEYINTNKDEAAVAQAVEKKQQLEKIYNDTYNELKYIMPEQEAKSNAALIRNSAFFYANEFGISPEEFIKKRGVKVVKSDYEQFKGNKATEDIPIMQVTQKDLNYARSHPEWKNNAEIIKMIGQAGADINDDINTINKALKQYSIEENKFRKEKEDAYYNLLALDLEEGQQERYAMMVENGVKPQDAYNAVTYTEDYIPFQTGVAEIDNSQLYQNLPQDLKDAVDFIYTSDPVYEVTGKEFPNDGTSLNKRVLQYFTDKFQNVVDVRDLGEVLLDARSVKDSTIHGLSSNKANAFAAVPYVLKNGKMFLSEEHYKGKNENRYVFVAPIKLNNEDYFCEVVVRQGIETQKGVEKLGKRRFYIHEVELTKKLSDDFTTFQQGSSSSSKSIISKQINDVKKNLQSQGGEERNLVAVHSISASSLEKAIDFGGFAVPSIAIVNKNQEFHFDDQPITLVGNKEMIDPYDERNEVYNRDVWSKTFPNKTYKTPSYAKTRKFREKFGDFFKRSVSENSLGSFLYAAEIGNPSSALSEFSRSSGAILYYLEEVKGEKVELPKRDMSSDYLSGMDEQLASEIKDLDASENKKEISEAVKRMIDREIERKKQKIDPNSKFAEKIIKVYKETFLERDFDDNDLIYFGVADRFVNNANKYYRSKGKEVLDHYEVNRFLLDKVKDDSNYQDWATKFFEKELVGEPMVEVGNKLKPFTLENVVDAMVNGATVATQESVFFGSGKIIASGAKKLESLSDIREEGKKLVTKEQSQKNMDEIKEQINTFTQNFMDTDDFSHNMSRKEASGEAIAQIVKNKTITKESLRKALNKHLVEKNSYPDDVLSYGVTLANNIKEMSRYYFEAKPQRAVGLTEFSGAIIPTDPEFDAIAKKVQDNGLKVVRSDDQVEAMKQFEKVYFQSAFAGSRVDYDSPSLEAIGSGEGNQVHGWGLYYALSKRVAAKNYYERFKRETPAHFVYDGKPIHIKLQELIGQEFMKESTLDTIDKVAKKSNVANIKENLLVGMEKESKKLKSSNKYDSIEKKKILDSINVIKNMDDSLFEFVKPQLLEFEIPENPYLLDEQLKFNEQPEYVKEKLLEVFDSLSPQQAKKITGDENVPVKNFLMWKTGKEIYQNIASSMDEFILDKDGNVDDYNNPYKQASLLLEKHGIKGITYEGRQDGRCFVIFNPNDVKVIQKFYQDGANDPKGAYVNRIIHLFQNADASTLPHELAHFWKDTLKDAAKISKRAAKMLEDVEKWAEQEFNRKYSIQLKDGRYVVNNKQGLTVYDHNFRTEADAKEYAKEELFAQGNEAYLKEGVAPNNSLKQAFRNFLNWLKHIYNQARQLDIRLSPEIRQVYADILGGTEIDFFLNTDPDTFVENRIKLATETVKTLDEQIAEAQRMGVSVSEPDGRGLKHVWETAMIPLSTRLGRVSNKLKNRLRRYEFDIANSLNHYYDEARPFLQKWKTFSEMDTIAFDIALKNYYVKKQLEIVDKYGAREEWEKVRKLLLDIFDSAVKAGLDVNFRPDYFPRKVKDVQGFLSYLRGRPEWTKFEEALRDADPDHTFTAEEQADFINKYLRGFIKVDLMPYKYGSEKQRSIEIINNEMNKYYAPSMESLVSYIEGMNARIEASKFLGKDAGDSSKQLEISIGGYLDYLMNNNELDPNKVDEVREVLRARFGQKGVGNKWVAGARNISYMYTMGGINSAITQIEDLSVSMYKAGIWNTLTTAFENKKIKRADLGLDKISAEFVENPSRTARGVDKLFKLTGLDKIDSFGKETLVNAMVKKFKQMSEESLRQYIEPIMEQETTQTIQDIKNGEMSDNVLYLVFSELSDVQPISLSELPAFYNTSGNMRVLYMLKSFMVKRIDIFRNECFDKLRSKNKEARIQGIQNLFKLAILMIFCGVSKDWLINLLYGRKMDIPEVVVNNALGLVGFSKFHAYQLRDKGAGEVIKDFLMPPMFALYDDLLGDVVKISTGKRKLKDAETLKGIPLVGRFYYWHIGRGKEKQKKKSKLK